jgi:hypothetical protein
MDAPDALATAPAEQILGHDIHLGAIFQRGLSHRIPRIAKKLERGVGSVKVADMGANSAKMSDDDED